MQIWFTNKFINRAQFHIFSHSLQFMGTINTYNKPLSIQLHLLWRIPRLSLVSKLYLILCFWYLIFFFSSRFRPPNIINFATVVYSNSTFLTFYFNIHHPTSQFLVSLLSWRYVHFKWIPLNHFPLGKMSKLV